MVGVTVLTRDTAFTRDDLDALPDDGRRHELVDGALVVTPAPRPQHQRAVGRMFRTLADALDGTGIETMVAPLDVVLAGDTIVQPDLVVAPREAFGERDLPVPPLLAVEVLSPTTRRLDLNLKRDRYAAAGIRHYWVVDTDEPSITVLRLGDEHLYVEIAHASGDEEISLDDPVSITLVPQRLVD